MTTTDQASTETTNLADVRCAETCKEASSTVLLGEHEPRCEDDKGHDWQSPHSIVGGFEEAPGVESNGTGLLITKVCMRCGCGRHTATWAAQLGAGECNKIVAYKAGEFCVQVAEGGDGSREQSRRG